MAVNKKLLRWINYSINLRTMTAAKFIIVFMSLTQKISAVVPAAGNTYLLATLTFPLLVVFLCISVTLFLGYRMFKLRLPDQRHVTSIFGPRYRENLEHQCGLEGTCLCHPYLTELASFRKFSTITAKAVENFESPSKDKSYSIIGHRGAGLNAPENSLAALRKCAERGCKMVEFDVSLTKDKVPVLFHDDNLLRITGVDRRISEINWEDLKRIDISDKFPGERVPTLDEAVEECLSLGLKFIVDIKDESDQLIEAIVSIFQRHKEKAYCSGVVSSFYFRVIYKIRSRDSNIVASMAWRPSSFALPPVIKSTDKMLNKQFKWLLVKVMYLVNDFAMHHLYWRLIGLSAILVHKDALNMELVHKIKKRGLRVYAWTVNCPVEKQYVLNKLQVGYLTDTLDTDEDPFESISKCLCNNNNSK